MGNWMCQNKNLDLGNGISAHAHSAEITPYWYVTVNCTQAGMLMQVKGCVKESQLDAFCRRAAKFLWGEQHPPRAAQCQYHSTRITDCVMCKEFSQS